MNRIMNTIKAKDNQNDVGNLEHVEPEKWKDIEGYEGTYQVSNYGRVASLIYKNQYGTFEREKPKILSPSTDRDGYALLSLYKNRKGKTHKVHRLVAEHFIENPENKPQINHKDGVKTNNFYWNLEWATSSENTIHALDTGLRKPFAGEEHASSKLKEKDVLEIRRLYRDTDTTHRELGEIYGINRTTIGYITRRETWKHI